MYFTNHSGSYKVIRIIQVNNFIYFTLSSVHYALITQNIDFVSPVREFFYNSELCFVALFFATEIYSYSTNFKEIVILWATIAFVFCSFLFIAVFITVEEFSNKYYYRDCTSALLLTSRILGLYLVLVYIYLAVRIIYILHGLKKILDEDKSKANKNDLRYALFRILVYTMLIIGSINIIEAIIQFTLNLDTCNFLKIKNPGEFSLVLIHRFFTYLFSFGIITYIFWFSRKSDKPDFIHHLRESLDYTENAVKERFDSFSSIN